MLHTHWFDFDEAAALIRNCSWINDRCDIYSAKHETIIPIRIRTNYIEIKK